MTCTKDAAPSIVFCTTCKGRLQHIERTLPENIHNNARAKFVLLDYNSQDGLSAWLRTHQRGNIDAGRLTVYRYFGEHPFRMAHAKNLAHRLGILEGADVLVNLDADNFTGPGFADYIAEKFQSSQNPKETYLWANVGRAKRRLPRGCSGRIVVSRHAFTNVGGYDEKYETWGPDDKDFNLRLGSLGCVGQEIDRQYLDAVLHNDKMRFKEYPEVAMEHGEDSLATEFIAPIVNYGKYGLGTVFRNFSHEPIQLNPVPTRVFGIGMHKTATTSLNNALGILGLDSAHWENAHWAKAIWTEMTTDGRSPTLERHYALSDLPITILYRKLDAAYPGSKFILTIRNEEEWIRSVANHWDPMVNKFRPRWNKDPFTHKIHKEVYGQRGFDREIFLARFRRHNAEVVEYFKGRDDLLVMDMSNGTGSWPTLCRFLRQPIPSVPYPNKFVTEEQS